MNGYAPSTRDEEERVDQTTEPRTGIPAAELEGRRERLLEHVRGEGLSGYVLFDSDYIRYFTSFWFLATERPVGFAPGAGGEVVGFGVEGVRAEAAFERVESAPEYRGREHPMLLFARVLADMGIGGAIGADQDG